MRGLTRLQRRVARIVLDAAEPCGLALAGGAGLVASGLSIRATEDIDAFSRSVTDLRPAAEAVISALEAAKLAVQRDQFEPNVVRLIVTAGEHRRRRHLRIELGRDWIEWPTVECPLGRVLSPRELAANKVLALFSRVKPRDLCDLAILAQRHDLARMLADAKTKEPGFSHPILAEMIRMVLTRDEPQWPPGIDIDAVRAFGQRVVKALEAGEDLQGVRPDGSVWSDE